MRARTVELEGRQVKFKGQGTGACQVCSKNGQVTARLGGDSGGQEAAGSQEHAVEGCASLDGT